MMKGHLSIALVYKPSSFQSLAQATGDLMMVRSLAGHACFDTTSRYLHAEAVQLHAQVTRTLVTPASR